MNKLRFLILTIVIITYTQTSNSGCCKITSTKGPIGGQFEIDYQPAANEEECTKIANGLRYKYMTNKKAKFTNKECPSEEEIEKNEKLKEKLKVLTFGK